MSTHRSKTGSGCLQQPEYLFIGYSHWLLQSLTVLSSAIPLWIFYPLSNGSVSTQNLVYFNHQFMDLFQSFFNGSVSIGHFNGSVSILFQWICFNPTFQWIYFNLTKTNGSISIHKIPWVSLNPIHIFIQYIYRSVSTPTTIYE